MIGPREQFLCVLPNLPLYKADAVVVMSGDSVSRLDFALGLWPGSGAEKLVISGGLDAPPFSLPAQELARRAIDKGVDPSRIVVEGESRNTREQAVNVVEMAMDHDWTSLVLVASHFHQWRAFLSFVQALHDAGKHESIRVINAPATHLPWFVEEPSTKRDRLSMLANEMARIEEYRAKGHVASFEDGMAYLRYWEGRRDAA